jgi:hypothetical protein
MAPFRVAPLPKLLRQGVVLPGQTLVLEILETLMHQVEGLVDQLGRLLRGHGVARRGWGGCRGAERLAL